MSAEVAELTGQSAEPEDTTPSEDQLTAQTHDELDRLDPLPLVLKLKSGQEFEVQPLKLRQFLALLRILTRGATGVLATGGLSSRDSDDFARQLMMILLFAIPEAEEETIDFIKAISKPKLTGNPQADTDLADTFEKDLNDPELEDIVLILQAIVEQEADDLRSLGNRLKSMMKTAEKMGLTGKKEAQQ